MAPEARNIGFILPSKGRVLAGRDWIPARMVVKQVVTVSAHPLHPLAHVEQLTRYVGRTGLARKPSRGAGQSRGYAVVCDDIAVFVEVDDSESLDTGITIDLADAS